MAVRDSVPSANNAAPINTTTGQPNNLIADMVAIINQLSVAVGELDTAAANPVTVLPDSIAYTTGKTPT